MECVPLVAPVSVKTIIMPKALIIAEKPSVAADLARALAKAPGMTAFTKEKDYFENETHVISSAVGHLIELGMPEVNGKKIGWGWTHLPIMPEEFELKPIADSADRFKLLSKLMKRKDVDSLINACDAGREGELIFRYIVEAVDLPLSVDFEGAYSEDPEQGAANVVRLAETGAPTRRTSSRSSTPAPERSTSTASSC